MKIIRSVIARFVLFWLTGLGLLVVLGVSPSVDQALRYGIGALVVAVAYEFLVVRSVPRESSDARL